MNALETFISDPSNFWTRDEAMNALQNSGVISDNCVTPADVAEADCQKAIEHLQANDRPA